jgi:D-alanyl-D-alanine dipeptidase
LAQTAASATIDDSALTGRVSRVALQRLPERPGSHPEAKHFSGRRQALTGDPPDFLKRLANQTSNILLNISDTRVAQMPVVDCGEPLVSLETLHARILVDDSPKNREHLGYTPIFSVRKTVGEMLIAAAESLPADFSLLIKESLRPASIQQLFFKRRLATLSKQNPLLGQQQLIALTARFIAPPWVGGHPSGGAIDVTLSDSSGGELDLGCGYDQDEEASGGACISGFAHLAGPAREHRALLFATLGEVQFVNYPFEWWHWSYGDRYWAVVQQQSHAIYAAVSA